MLGKTIFTVTILDILFIVTYRGVIMKNCVLLMTFQAFVMNSVVFGYHGNKGCTRFIDDTSSLEDDSDYQLDGSGSVISHYDVGGIMMINVM